MNYDKFNLQLQAGVTYTFEHSSTAFNALLTLRNGLNTQTIMQDDNGGGGTNAKLVYKPTQSVNFVLWAGAKAMGQTGASTLNVRR